MRDRGWIIAQFAVAAVLLVISLVGVIGLVAFDMAELSFSFAGGIQAFAIFPGLVLSLTVNALVMRAHRAVGLNLAEKILLIIEGALIAALLVFHFYTDPAGATFGLAIVTWPVIILLAIAIAIVAITRAVSVRQNPPSAPPAPPSPITPDASAP
jgi:hypothetical protein